MVGVESLEVRRHARQPGRRAIGRDHELRGPRQLERLAARRGAEITGDDARGERRITSDERGRGILHEAMTLPPHRQLEERRAGRELEAVRNQRDVMGSDAAPLERCLQLLAHQAPRPQDHARLLVVPLEEDGRGLRAES